MKKYENASDIKVGAIGYGGAFNMGKKHLQSMADAGMTPGAVCELDPARLEVAQEDFPGIETYQDLGEMLEQSDVDLLAIITPHNTHAPLALQCLKAGRHVVCEKPLAITTDECDAMIAAAEENDAMLSTYHNRHWDGCVLQAVKKIVEEKAIGEVVRIQCRMGGYGPPRDWWRSSKSISGGILYDWGVHLLEYSLQLLPGEKMVEVTGFAHKGFWAEQNPYGEDANEDEAQAIVRFESGRRLDLRITSIDCNPKPGRLEITGTKGTYVMEGGSYEIITPGEEEKNVEKGENPEGEQWRYYQNVADFLTDKEDLVITGEWARRPIHILDLANRSAEQGQALETTYK
jgi:predicted dehydrogenase